MHAYITQDRQHEISSRGLMTNNIRVKTTWASWLNFCALGVFFFLGLINTGAVLMEEVGCESASVRLLLRQRLWMAALGIQQNKAQSELKQAALEKQQHSVIQPLACAPEHCVYICNLTHPLGSLRPHPHPTLVFPALSLSSIHILIQLFSLRKYIVKQRCPRTSRWWPPQL